jgi:hypothetical protein
VVRRARKARLGDTIAEEFGLIVDAVPTSNWAAVDMVEALGVRAVMVPVGVTAVKLTRS